jgi:hypothetical protein
VVGGVGPVMAMTSDGVPGGRSHVTATGVAAAACREAARMDFCMPLKYICAREIECRSIQYELKGAMS